MKSEDLIKLNTRLKLEPDKPVMINHFDKKTLISFKNGLVKSLLAYYQKLDAARVANYSAFDTTPTTFIIEHQTINNSRCLNEFNLLSLKFRDISKGNLAGERMPAKHCSANIWVIKPTTWNRGKGIEIFRSLRDIQDHISRCEHVKDWVI